MSKTIFRNLILIIIFIFAYSGNANTKIQDILKLEQICGKSKAGKPGWDDKFFGTVTDNTFQAIRYWKAKPGDKRYKVYYVLTNGVEKEAIISFRKRKTNTKFRRDIELWFGKPITDIGPTIEHINY